MEQFNGEYGPAFTVIVAVAVLVEDHSFVSAGPRVWNSLPEDVTFAPSLPVFRRKLKTHLFW